MNLQSATVDVIIPVYNGERFIREAVNSIIAQTLPVQNIFIIDDGSSDRTKEVVYDIIKNSPISIHYINEKNYGPSAARNKGIRLSKAEYVAFLDADDVWHPQKIEKQINVFKSSSDKKLGAVYCQFDVLHEGTDQARYQKTPPQSGNLFSYLLNGTGALCTPSLLLFKKEVFNSIGLFDEKLRSGEDWDILLRTAKNFHFDFCNEILLMVRDHSENTSKNTYYILHNQLFFIEKWMGVFKDKPMLKQWRKTYAYAHYKNILSFNEIGKVLTTQQIKTLYPFGFSMYTTPKIPFWILKQWIKNLLYLFAKKHE